MVVEVASFPAVLRWIAVPDPAAAWEAASVKASEAFVSVVVELAAAVAVTSDVIIV